MLLIALWWRVPRHARLASIAALAPLLAACGTSDARSHDLQPDLASISPDSGKAGTKVWLNGRGFESGASVHFGSFTADSVEFVSAIMLAAYVPDDVEAGAVYDVEVRNPGGKMDSLAEAYRVPARVRPTAGGTARLVENPASPVMEEESARISATGDGQHPSGERALLGREDR